MHLEKVLKRYQHSNPLLDDRIILLKNSEAESKNLTSSKFQAVKLLVKWRALRCTNALKNQRLLIVFVSCTGDEKLSKHRKQLLF